MNCEVEGCEEPAEPLMPCRGCAGLYCIHHMNAPLTMAHNRSDHDGRLTEKRIDRAVEKARAILAKIPAGPIGTEPHGRGEILTIGGFGHPLNIVGLVDPASQWHDVRELIVWSAEFADILASVVIPVREEAKREDLRAKSVSATRAAKDAFYEQPSHERLAEWERSLEALREGSAWGQQEARNHEEEIKTERAAMVIDESIRSTPTMEKAFLTADYLCRQTIIGGMRRGLRCSQRVAAWIGAQQNAVYVPLEAFDRHGSRRDGC